MFTRVLYRFIKIKENTILKDRRDSFFQFFVPPFVTFPSHSLFLTRFQNRQAVLRLLLKHRVSSSRCSSRRNFQKVGNESWHGGLAYVTATVFVAAKANAAVEIRKVQWRIYCFNQKTGNVLANALGSAAATETLSRLAYLRWIASDFLRNCGICEFCCFEKNCIELFLFYNLSHDSLYFFIEDFHFAIFSRNNCTL